MFRNYYFYFLLILSAVFQSQDLTGKWVETIKDDAINAYAEITIQSQDLKSISGYSFDVTTDAPSKNFDGQMIDEGRCSFKFSGSYDYNNKFLDISSTKQIFRTEQHAPGRWILVYSKEGDEEYLTGKILGLGELPYVTGYNNLKSLLYTDGRNMAYVNGVYVGNPNFGVGDYYTFVRYKKVPEDYETNDPDLVDLVRQSPRPEELIDTSIDKNVKLGRSNDNYFAEKELQNNETSGTITYFPKKEELPDPDNEVEEQPLAQVAPKPVPEDVVVNTPPSAPIEEENIPKVVEIPDEPEIIPPADPIVSVSLPDEPEEKEEEPSVFTIDDQGFTEEEVENEEEFVPETVTQDDEAEVKSNYASRNTKTIGNIRTNDQVLRLNIKDYGEQDGDLISIIVDGKVIYRNLPILTKSIDIEIPLVTNKKQNEIIFVAENLGKVPPNTARITMSLNGKEYSYSLLTDTSTNARIVLQRN